MSLSASASLEFTIPDSVWAFRFVYKSEKYGDTCTISVAEGNGLVQVYDVWTDAWVEANGFGFSTAQPHDSTARAGLPYGDLSEGYGNTIHGKRLKMRCRNGDGTFSSYDSAKTVTITKSSDTSKRLSYWGVEWSPKRYMLTVINAGRGSGSYQTDDFQPPDPFYVLSSPFFAQTDIFVFEPDLLCIEVSNNRFGNAPPGRIATIEKWYFNELGGDPLSIDSLRSDSTDVLYYNSSAGSVNYRDDGFPEGSYWNGEYLTNHDLRDYIAHWYRTEKPLIPFSDSHGAMREASIKFFGSYQAGIQATGNTGYSLITDGVHPNYWGYLCMWKYIQPWFKF